MSDKRRKVVAEYQYPQAVKIRYDDKSFCWKHWEDGQLKRGRKDIPHSLYHAEQIPESETVFLAEGEKDADTLTAMGFCGVSTEDGASSNPKKPKWYNAYTEQLRGKQVVILNDNDPVGLAHAESCANLLMSASADVLWVRWIPMDTLWPEVPEKGDISDMAAALGADETRRLLLEALEQTEVWSSPETRESAEVWEALGVAPMILSYRWDLHTDGIGRLVEIEEGEKIYEPFSSTPIVPVEILQNRDTGEQDIHLRALISGRQQDLIVPRKVLSVNNKLVETLAAKGVDVITDTARYMAAYFSDLLGYQNRLPIVTAVSHLGWVDGEFLPYSTDSSVRFSGTEVDRETYDALNRQQGTLEEWVDFVRPLRKNLTLRLMLAASFASPLIELIGAQPFIFHLWGTTGIGKTVALRLAMSIWGDARNEGLVNTTDNTLTAMCITASTLQHLPFAADELQLIKKRPGENYDSFIMTFCEGKERGRANQNAEKKRQRTWKSCALVTGEEPITEANSGGGAKNRTIELQGTEKLFDDPAGVMDFLAGHFGTAGRAFIESVRNTGPEALQDTYRTFRRGLESTDATEKQKDAAALLMLGDLVSQIALFRGEAMLTPEELAPCLKRESEVRTSARAREFLVDWIAENAGHFPKVLGDDGSQRCDHALTIDEPNVQIYGAVVEKNHVLIICNVLRIALAEQGFQLQALVDDWLRDGFLERCSSRADCGSWKKQTAVRVRSFADGAYHTKELRPRCCALHLNPDWTNQADNAVYAGELEPGPRDDSRKEDRKDTRDIQLAIPEPPGEAC